jgi:hypothetical protein
MLWVTKKRIRIARAATCWLIERHLDTDARFLFVDEEDVARLQVEQGATGFHARGAKYPAMDATGRVAFQALVDELRGGDEALQRLGRIVRDADRAPRDRPAEPEATGLRMISVSFPDVCDDDHRIVAESRLLYDALYFTLKKSS